ncbi:MAG: hypothetical protein AB7V16_03020 [Vulcanibacillus sp.]
MIIKDKSGATLIELLAVLSLISLILLVITSSQLIWFNSTSNTPKQTLDQERLRFAFEQVVMDIEAAESIVCTPSNGIEQTLSLNITKPSEVVIYLYDTDRNELSVTKQGDNYLLAESVISFIIYLDDGTYYIEGMIEGIDLKTNQPYTLTTSAKPIVW